MKNRRGVGRKGSEILESRWTRAGGLLIHSRASDGPAAGQDLPPLVLVHGLGVSGRYMVRLAERLAPHRAVHVPDLPGFGRSMKPRRALNIGELAEALAGWMDEAGLGRATLLANSIGCQVIVDLALGRPELVAHLVLVSPTVDRHARTVPRQFFRLLLDIPREPVSLAFIALTDYLRAGLGRTAKTFAYALQDGTERKMPHVSQPALVVRGASDPVVSGRWAEEVSALLPAGRLLVMPGAGHAVNYNSPDRLARAVLDFLLT